MKPSSPTTILGDTCHLGYQGRRRMRLRIGGRRPPYQASSRSPSDPAWQAGGRGARPVTVRMTRRVSVGRQRARIAAFALHSQGKTSTAAATRTLLTRFENQADPRREPPEWERQRRALAARRAHMARLALRSARARQRRVRVSNQA